MGQIVQKSHTIQHQLRSAYWNYVNEIVTSTDDGTQKPSYAKKCWTYTKHCRTDHTGVTPLKTKWSPTFKPQSQSRDTKSTVSVSLYR